MKNSTSDLFLNNCDEFIYYDDLVRVPPVRPRPRIVVPPGTVRPATATPKDAAAGPTLDQALDLVTETLDALGEERGGDDPIWGSMIKQTLRRRHPGFNERAHGFRSFNDLLHEAQKRGLLRLEADEKSGGYIVRAPE